MFKFDFDLDDLVQSDASTQFNLAQNAQMLPSNNNTSLPADQTHAKSRADSPCVEISVNELIHQLPPFISFSRLTISPEITIFKRELYDAKYQTLVNLMGEEEDSEAEDEKEKGKHDDEFNKAQKTLESIQSTSDLIPGVYEGGFKTWECSLDLAANLSQILDRLKNHIFARKTNSQDQQKNDHHHKKTFTILELGCGTAIPTASLCFQLFGYLLHFNCQKSSDEAERLSFDLSRSHLNAIDKDNQEPPVLEIILQDFNSDVLKLLTVPNILLAFYRAKMKLEEKDKSRVGEKKINQEPEEDLEITDTLRAEFLSFLKLHDIRMTFVYGPWSTFKIPAPRIGSSNEELIRTCQVILSSETLYSIDSIPDFINVLINCKINSNQPSDQDQQTTILVASKSLYFGVGGGTHAFTHALKKFNASVTFLDIPNYNLVNSGGVSRVLMSVKFAS